MTEKSGRKVVPELLAKCHRAVYFGTGKTLKVPSYCFWLHPYGNQVYVYIGPNHNEVHGLSRFGGGNPTARVVPNFPHPTSFTVMLPEEVSLANDAGMIAHEASHIALHLLPRIGINVGPKLGTDEAYAYVISDIVEVLNHIIEHHRTKHARTIKRPGKA